MTTTVLPRVNYLNVSHGDASRGRRQNAKIDAPQQTMQIRQMRAPRPPKKRSVRYPPYRTRPWAWYPLG